MTPDIQNLKEMWSTAIPPAFYEKSPVNFGPQTKKFYWLELSHPSGFFGGRPYFSPYGVLRPEIYTRATDFPSLDSAHPKWDGGPPPKKKLIVKI